MTEETCGGAGCTCKAGENGFCSDYCKEHASADGHTADTCQCGHSHCEAAVAAE
ncbi:MAG: hypothetical protein QOE11_1769 [Solirubrobacteraceae bacterium]|jgi:hypothetical protein|nr:hypothetical protein [Solirubrobacteraceae bacterium]